MKFFVGSDKFVSRFKNGASLSSAKNLSFGAGFVVGTAASYKTYGSTNIAFGGARLTEDSFLSHWNFENASKDEVYRHYENRLTDFSLGVFGLLSWNEDSWEVTLDRLAQYAIFVWREGEDYLISNSLELMVQVLRLNRILAKKSTKNATDALIYGTSFGGATGYEGISLYRSTQLFFKEGALHFEDCDFLVRLYEKNNASYEQSLAETVSFLKKAANNLTPDKVGGMLLSDLTGGVDSRLVVSLLMCSPLSSEEINVFCLGSDARADKIVADYLVEKYGFKPGTFYSAKSPEGASPADSIERGVRRFHGMKLADFGDFGDGRIVGQTKVTGYYGELTRLFYNFEENPNNVLVDNLVAIGGVKKYFNTDAIQGFRGRVGDFLDRMDQLGIDFEDKLNALYLLNRNKAHFGMSAYLADRTRQAFHPLCSSLFTKLSGKLSREDRAANRVAFDVISGLCEKLLCEPMAEKVWSRRLFSDDFDYERYADSCFVDNGASALSSQRYKYGQRNLLHAAQDKVQVDPQFSERMRSLGIQYHWALLPDVVSRLNVYLDRVEGSNIADSVTAILNIDNVRSLLKNIDFGAQSHRETGLNNNEAKFLLKLLSTLSWVVGDDTLTTVDYKFDVTQL